MKISCAPWIRWSAAFLLAGPGLVAIAGAQPPPPVLRARAELFTLEVQVVAARGKALPGLTAEQFDVRVGGTRVVSCSWNGFASTAVIHAPAPG